MSWGETIFLKNFIKGQKVFVGGTSAIAPAATTDSIHNLTYYTFTPKVDGVITIKASLYTTHQNGCTAKIVLHGGETTLYSEEIVVPYMSPATYYFDFQINRNNVYEITIERNTGDGLPVGNCYFCGQVTDYNYFETAVIG